MATNPGTVLQVVCNFNMLYIGCQYQVIKKVKKKKRKADLPYLSFLQDEIGNTHIFFLALFNNYFHNADHFCMPCNQPTITQEKNRVAWPKNWVGRGTTATFF